MKRIILDLSKIKEYSYSCGDVILSKLKRVKLYDKNYLYSVFDADRLNEFLINGTYRPHTNTIFAFNVEEFSPSFGREVMESLTHYLDIYDNPGIGIYDGRKFEHAVYPEYKFKEPQNKLGALIGIVERIIWPEITGRVVS